MKVRDVMTKNVFTATPDMPLKSAATRMLHYGVSGMPVVDGERVLGVISETDILFKERTAPDRGGLLDWLAHYGEDPPRIKLEARTVGEAMTTPAVTIVPGRSVPDAAGLMLDLEIDRLPVVSGERLVGIVTRADLVRAFSREDHEIERELRDGIVRHFWMASSRVRITVVEGSLILAGEVDSEELAEAVAVFAAKTPGVVSVETRLRWPGKAGVSADAEEPVTGA
jgi:CBS domain-containing protein